MIVWILLYYIIYTYHTSPAFIIMNSPLSVSLNSDLDKASKACPCPPQSKSSEDKLCGILHADHDGLEGWDMLGP